MAKTKAPEILSLTADELEQLLVELRAQLVAATYLRVELLLRTLQWVLGVIQEQKTTLARLWRMIFGTKSEKTSKLFDQTVAAPDNSAKPPLKAKGHGRHGAEDYPGARRVAVPHAQRRVGELCPKCLKGKLYRLITPARIMRIVAQPIFTATCFELERLRCALCGALFTAPAPPESGDNKYDPSVGIMAALMRYGAGMAMYRIDKWQHHFGVPLPAATQWEQIEAISEIPALVLAAMIDFAAGGQLFYNDDTVMRVLALRKEIAAAKEAGGRTGIFTTCIIAQVDQIRVALFFTGQKHAGENLNQVLHRRATGLAEPLQMCDALTRNESKDFHTILCHCLLHARRNYVELIPSFPQECRKVFESLREVYHFEAMTQQPKLSDLERLAFHQEHSQPVMAQLHQWMQAQIDQKLVEPNSGLGEAIDYMLKRWKTLTRFLSVPGAPLDNNITERGLKSAILHRKNSLNYKTLHGAKIGDLHMSLIHTCELNGANPFDYLTALHKNAAAVRQDPTLWFPWNFRKNLERPDSS